jgi:Ca-activated chloride channel family protein
MKEKRKWFILMVLAVSVIITSPAWPQPERDSGRTLSPYFFVKSDDPEVDQLPLKSTSVGVNISGVIADVFVTQVYKNEGKRPLEAIYVFPASTRAAVYGMKMTIGERTITAKIRKREAARREYEEAKQSGKSASLLEQKRPNVFQMNVANILPSDVITVELRYTELLVPTDAVYEFVYPTVVGPRYANLSAAEAPLSERWIENPYLHEGESPPYTFDIGVKLAAGLPIQDVTCASHKVHIDYAGPALAAIKLDSSGAHGGNRDYVLKYRLAGGKIETGLLLFEGEEENFFLLMLQPPRRVREAEIPPREYVFIVDVSGSMHGFPLNISKKLLKDLVGRLRPTDRFNVLLFAGGSSVMANQSLPATPENIRRAINLIDRQRGGGGTELLPALRRALCLPKTEGYSHTIVIATDGYVTVEAEAFDLIRNNLGKANLFAFGIGSSVNRHIIEGMARVGMGEPFVITTPEEASEKAEIFRRLIELPVLTDIRADFDGFEVYDAEPLTIPDVLADRPVIVFGKWRGRPEGTIRFRGITGDGPFTEHIDVSRVSPLETNSALRYLWARHRIAILSDYNQLRPDDERVREVTNLGLSYNLLTAYTSFIAIDTQIRLKDGQVVTVKQPLPLPQGVSDYAVGNRGAVTKACVAMAPSQAMAGAAGSITELGYEAKEERVAWDATLPASGVRRDPIGLKKIAVTEGLPRESVQSLIEAHLTAINRCYREASAKGSKFKGEAVFTMVIDAKGRVAKVRQNGTERENQDLERCVIQALERVVFPAPEEGKRVVVTIVFIVT